MCGIAGIHWESERSNRRELLESVVPLLRSRGPDEAGIYFDNNMGLVHTRLSIIDHAGGKQPFCLGPDQPLLVFNGEIFNYPELRVALQSEGTVLSTNSDTEVLYLLLCKYGESAVSRLNGQFAFCFYDPRTQVAILARDQFGEKPLYYSDATDFIFASEFKAISALAGRELSLSAESMTAMTSLWAPAPTSTVWEGIKALPPGHILKKDAGELTLKSYINACGATESTIVPTGEEVRSQFGEAVRQRMVSDVPIGLFLSGGLDSSLVGYEVAQRTSQKLKSYSVAFENQEFDESAEQRIISEFLGTTHQTLFVTDKTVVENFEDALLAAESPSPRSAFVPMYLLCKEVRKDALKVILTGEGADEIFLGYDLFREIMVKQAIRDGADLEAVMPMLEGLNAFMPSQKNRQKFLALKYSNYRKLAEREDIFSSHTERANLGAIARMFFQSEDIDHTWAGYLTTKYRNFSSRSELERGKLIERESLLSGHLLSTQGDRVSMGNSVETRPPFLDKNLVKFADKIAHEAQFDSHYGEKAVLKRAYDGLVPNEIIMRQKFPYRAPDSLSFANQYGREYVMDRLQNSTNSLFNVNKFRDFCEKLLLKDNISPRENHAFMLILSGIVVEQIMKLPLSMPQIGLTEQRSVSTNYGAVVFYGESS